MVKYLLKNVKGNSSVITFRRKQMAVFLSALLPVKHKEQMLLFLTLGISARWVLGLPISDASAFLALRCGCFREGAGG